MTPSSQIEPKLQLRIVYKVARIGGVKIFSPCSRPSTFQFIVHANWKRQWKVLGGAVINWVCRSKSLNAYNTNFFHLRDFNAMQQTFFHFWSSHQTTNSLYIPAHICSYMTLQRPSNHSLAQHFGHIYLLSSSSLINAHQTPLCSYSLTSSLL